MANESSSASNGKGKEVVVYIPEDDSSTETNGPRKRTRDGETSMQNENGEEAEMAVVLLPEAKFKGVVPQQNGNWGAQIYAHHQRVWLGTFKSARLAAMAYDSAAIKLRSGDLHRNFPWTSLTLQEPQFQAHYSSEAVLSMIKDGTYQSKFEHFVRVRTLAPRSTMLALGSSSSVEEHSPLTPSVPSPLDFSSIRVWSADSATVETTRKMLFQKELTPSDVGKLNRLVIPKTYAMKHFPFISEENGDEPDDVELVFYDKQLTPWRFRYCYWKSSQSYVFTRGWNRFVKENGLKANDVVAFYSCESGANQRFCLIDATASNIGTANLPSPPPAMNHNAKAKGFRLFGVDIK